MDTPPIKPLSTALSNYIAGFDLAALALYHDGRICVTGDPGGTAAAWWCESDKAGVLLEAAQKGRSIPVAGRALGITITPHDVVVARASAAVARIDAVLARAQANGGLKFFNGEYRRRREAARANGRSFMSYQQAQARLRKELAMVAAGRVTADLVARVFST